jgi:hypothetical protein
MKLRYGLFISIMLHILILLFSLLFAGAGEGEGNGHDKNGTRREGPEGSKYNGINAGNVLPKDRPVEVNLVEKPEEKPEIILKKKKKKSINAEKECPGKWYGGIGIQSSFNEIISQVYPGYPADLAGLEKGDTIISTDGAEILGEPGTVLHITVRRNDKIIKYTIIRGKVCLH